MPFFAALHRGQSGVAVVDERAIVGIRPGNVVREELDDSPMREDALHLFRVREFKRAQDEAGGFELRDHFSIVASWLKQRWRPEGLHRFSHSEQSYCLGVVVEGRGVV
jgi:hypothetical protein